MRSKKSWPMKWFKHHTDSFKSDTLQQLSLDFGKAKAYGLYFLFFDYLSGKYDGINTEPQFTLTYSELLSFLKLKQNKLITFLKRIENDRNLFLTYNKIIEKGN